MFGCRHQNPISGVPRAFLARDTKTAERSYSISAVHFVPLAAVLIFHVGTNNEYPSFSLRLMCHIGTHNSHSLSILNTRRNGARGAIPPIGIHDSWHRGYLRLFYTKVRKRLVAPSIATYMTAVAVMKTDREGVQKSTTRVHLMIILTVGLFCTTNWAFVLVLITLESLKTMSLRLPKILGFRLKSPFWHAV